MAEPLETSLKKSLLPIPSRAVVYIAYSGGLDSQVLLHLAAQLYKQFDFELRALHVNHGISEHAGQWQAFCRAQCEGLDVELRSHRPVLDLAAGNLEQRAREARYSWFEETLETGDLLLMAHHRDDQAETMILRLLRGSGVRGLSGIPHGRMLGSGRLLRPFLQHAKSELYAYAERHGLEWIEDESNYSTDFDRNYIRHQVLPALVQRWPQAVQQLALSSRNCTEEQSLLDDLADADIRGMSGRMESMWLEQAPPLNASVFCALSKARQRNVLNRVLRPLTSYPVAADQMNEWLRQLVQRSTESRPRLQLAEVVLAVHDGWIHFASPHAFQEAGYRLRWKTDAPLALPVENLVLRLVETTAAAPDELDAIAFEPGDLLCMHSRQGGERVRMPGEAFSRSLKKLYQERRIAPWLRQSMPLVSLGEQVVWSALLGDLSPRLVDSEGRFYSFKLERDGQI